MGGGGAGGVGGGGGRGGGGGGGGRGAGGVKNPRNITTNNSQDLKIPPSHTQDVAVPPPTALTDPVSVTLNVVCCPSDLTPPILWAPTTHALIRYAAAHATLMTGNASSENGVSATRLMRQVPEVHCATLKPRVPDQILTSKVSGSRRIDWVARKQSSSVG